MKKLLILNGPNLNLMGEREPGVYGNESLDDINRQIEQKGKELGFECHFFQSNCACGSLSKVICSFAIRTRF